MEKLCKNCGALFSRSQKKGLYCSRVCFAAQNKGGFKKGDRAWNEGMKGISLNRNFIDNNPSKPGELSFHWKKDRSTLVKRQERNDSAYKGWRKSVRDRDGWLCKMVNSDCLGKVVAHHILPWAEFPELRYEVNNGITLCNFHHPRKRDEEMRLSPYFQSLLVNET